RRSVFACARFTWSLRPFTSTLESADTALLAAWALPSVTKPKPRGRPSGPVGKCTRTTASAPLSRNNCSTSFWDMSNGKFPTYRVRSFAADVSGLLSGPRFCGPAENGRTDIERPDCSDPSNEERALAASSGEANVTNPKPRARPVNLSLGRLTLTTVTPVA